MWGIVSVLFRVCLACTPPPLVQPAEPSFHANQLAQEMDAAVRAANELASTGRADKVPARPPPLPCVRVCACARECVCACVRSCAQLCVCTCVCVRVRACPECAMGGCPWTPIPRAG
jgi:hypothetical protein